LSHPLLETLELDGCDIKRLSLRCASLRQLSIHASGVAFMSPAALPALTSLELSGCHALSDGSLREALASLSALRRVSVSGGMGVSDETLRAAAGALPALEVLALQACGTALAFNGLQVGARGARREGHMQWGLGLGARMAGCMQQVGGEAGGLLAVLVPAELPGVSGTSVPARLPCGAQRPAPSARCPC
jgi:hypothetical protein